jgi:hypothetical protein
MKNLFSKEISQVEEIYNMFEHLKKSAKVHGMDVTPFKFFGFPENTIQYHIFRKMMLGDDAVVDTSRYRDFNPNGLQRCVAMLNIYKSIIISVKEEQKTLSNEALVLLGQISDSYEKKVA